MTRGLPFSLAALGLFAALAGCGRGLWQSGERAQWRHEAEVNCLKAGSVHVGVNVVQMQPIEGPGICGADFPLKVTALGEANPAMSYADDLRPPGAIPNGAGPRWPVHDQAYTPPQSIAQPPAQPGAPRMQWNAGPQGIPQQTERPESVNYAPSSQPSASRGPMSISPPGLPAPPSSARPDDIPDDAVLPEDEEDARPAQHASRPPLAQPPVTQAPVRTMPPLGPSRQVAANAVAVNPPATLACPLVSALDRWISEGVQPAALHWFGVPVTEIKQISAYSCREMVGAGTSHISEHAFGNALDVAGFTLADGRTVSVVKGWHGSAEEQGFLHDVQLYACETFNTVLSPGYNAAHYNHIHVDLMRRDSGRRPCRPTAVPGEVVAAQVRARYAGKGAPAYTGSIGKIDSIGKMIAATKAGEDGLYDDDAEAPAKEQEQPLKPTKKLFDFSGWGMLQKSSLEAAPGSRADAY
jgi:hypothetical protein